MLDGSIIYGCGASKDEAIEKGSESEFIVG